MTNSYCICKSSNDVVRLFINLSYALYFEKPSETIYARKIRKELAVRYF